METIKTKTRQSLSIIAEAISKYPRLAVASSFGKDSMVVLHLANTLKPKIKVFAVMTVHKPQETRNFMERVRKEWELNLDVFSSPMDVGEQLSRTNPDECCRVLKVEPTKRALRSLDAWITGLRRDEGETRKDYEILEEVTIGNQTIVKVNPILWWTETDIWKYHALHQIPVHPWYGQGFRSLGCRLCTSIAGDESAERAGRWANTPKWRGECGIHTMGKRRPL
jgi:phosphoadenosine phosphosulfate reductase